MNIIIAHFKENWIRYGFETLVVTISILGAFMLNTWNQNRIEQNQMISSLHTMKEYLADDIERLEEEILFHDSIHTCLVDAMDLLERQAPLNTNDKQILANALWYYNWVDPIQSDLVSTSLMIEPNILLAFNNDLYLALMRYQKRHAVATGVAKKISEALLKHDLKIAIIRGRYNGGVDISTIDFDTLIGSKEIISLLELARSYQFGTYNVHYKNSLEEAYNLQKVLAKVLNAY